MSDFTPGPWETRRALKPVDGEFDFAVNDGKNDVIAEVFGRVSEVETRPAEANANLIAAAPELYEALNSLTECCWVGASGHMDHSAQDILDKALKVLARARGEA